MNSHERVIRLISEERWAILPSKLDQICEVVRLWCSGADMAPYAAKEKPEPSTVGNAIAVLPLFGMISRRANMMTDFSGGTSVAKFTNQFRAAMNEPEIGAIVIDIDSPGGGVFGVDELAAEIFQARKKKPIVAIANPVAASAALWIGSAASEFVVTPSGQAGSIGVYAMHQDMSKLNEQMGVKPTYVSAGKYKVEGNPDEPLGEEARAHMQADVDQYYHSFTSAVARNRGVKRDAVVNGFGQGRMLSSKDAVKERMADWVGTFDDVINRIARGEIGNGKRAEEIAPPLAVENDEVQGHIIYWTKAQYEE